MASVIAQISDVHIGGPRAGAGERFSQAVDAVNAMTRQPDVVLVTGDVTENGTDAQWDEFTRRAAALRAPLEVLRGNHDQSIASCSGHRAADVGHIRLVLLDSSTEVFSDEDAAWLDRELAAHTGRATAIAIHHPPFETGIWWMDCIGLSGAELFEAVVRRHGHVRHVMSGHVHRPITTTWDGCLLTTCPSTSVAIAADLDPAHDPGETDEPPMIALHAYVDDSVVSHVFTVGPTSARTPLAGIGFVAHVRELQAQRASPFER
jgi:3',5'-cyclic AMP phosphodiesterase CpdA